MISFLLKYTPCTCFIYLLAIASVNASPQKKTQDNIKKTVNPKIQLSFIPDTPNNNKNKNKALNLNLITEGSTYIDFNKMKPKSKIKKIKELYLTIYSRKKEKLKATYLHGTYAIHYSQKW